MHNLNPIHYLQRYINRRRLRREKREKRRGFQDGRNYAQELIHIGLSVEVLKENLSDWKGESPYERAFVQGFSTVIREIR